jgi:hypothetical protein
MATTQRRAILAQLLAYAGAITVENGYETDGGLRVYFGESPALGEDDPPTAIALVVLESLPQPRGGFIEEPVDVEVQALARASLDEPYIAAEVVLGDIMRAFEQADRTLGGLVKGEMTIGAIRTVPREAGSTTVGVSVVYRLSHLRRWGQP